MKKLLLTALSLALPLAMLAAQYTVKYQIKSKGSTSHRTATLELKNGTESEAKAELVRRGTVSKKNADKIVIVEIKKKND